MLIVADTSALVALAACDALGLLDSLFADVRVPRAVWHGCTIRGKPHAKRLEDYLSNKISDIDMADFVIAAPGLGRGELEAMALYKQLHADRLLLDDWRARKVARMNSIAVVGSLGVLVGAKAHGHIPAVAPYLARIEAAGIYLSRELAAETLRLAGEE
jgi:predicted nucleic acid-binding protein